MPSTLCKSASDSYSQAHSTKDLAASLVCSIIGLEPLHTSAQFRRNPRVRPALVIKELDTLEIMRPDTKCTPSS